MTKKSKNTDIKNGMYLFISVLVATIVGSIVGRYIPDTFLGSASIIMALILGVKFLVKPIMVPKIAFASLKRSTFITYSILCGTVAEAACLAYGGLPFHEGVGPAGNGGSFCAGGGEYGSCNTCGQPGGYA